MHTFCVKVLGFVLVLSVAGPCWAESKILSISASNGLTYTNNYAKLVGKAFGRYVGFSRYNIRLLRGPKSTKGNITNQIEMWLAREVTEHDLIVIFLAGHGFILENEYYFIPETKASLDNSKEVLIVANKGQFLSSSELKKMIRNINTRKKLLIIDSCHSGAFFQAREQHTTKLLP